MTPKEKADELFTKMDLLGVYSKIEASPSLAFVLAKQCALICVEEMLKCDLETNSKSALEYVRFWNEVKKEIEKF